MVAANCNAHPERRLNREFSQERAETGRAPARAKPLDVLGAPWSSSVRLQAQYHCEGARHGLMLALGGQLRSLTKGEPNGRSHA